MPLDRLTATLKEQQGTTKHKILYNSEAGFVSCWAQFNEGNNISAVLPRLLFVLFRIAQIFSFY